MSLKRRLNRGAREVGGEQESVASRSTGRPVQVESVDTGNVLFTLEVCGDIDKNHFTE